VTGRHVRPLISLAEKMLQFAKKIMKHGEEKITEKLSNGTRNLL
jgi:hypothetical protein